MCLLLMSLLMIPLVVGCGGGGDEKPAEAPWLNTDCGDNDADCDSATTADDCDDTDPSIYPGAPEVIDDGVDQDCNGHDAITCTGDYESAYAEHCAIITGTLTVNRDGSLPLLHSLEEVTGDLIFWLSSMPSLTSASIDSLLYVGGHLGIYGEDLNHPLNSVSFDSLSHVGGTLSFDGNSALTSISLDSLTDVGEGLTFAHNYALTSIILDRLTAIGGTLQVDFNTELVDFSFDSLTNIGGLRITDNSRLTSFSLEGLSTIGGIVQIWGNDSLCQSNVDSFVSAMEALGWDGGSMTSSNADC
jgi:hypothetical protein